MITSRTLYLDIYGLLWVAAVAVIVVGAALFVGYSAKQVAHAQEVKDAIEHGRHLAAPSPHHPHHSVGTADSGPAGPAKWLA